MGQTGKVGYMITRYFISFVFVMLVGLSAYSQKAKNEELSSQFPTENTRFGEEANKAKNRPDRKKISYLYVESSKNILYGNPCATEATRKMGFEYVVQPLGIPGSPEADELEKHNFLVKLKLFFTRGPFWKMVINKRIKECAQKSGDIVG